MLCSGCSMLLSSHLSCSLLLQLSLLRQRFLAQSLNLHLLSCHQLNNLIHFTDIININMLRKWHSMLMLLAPLASHRIHGSIVLPSQSCGSMVLTCQRSSSSQLPRHSPMLCRRSNMLRGKRSMLTLVALQTTLRRPCSIMLRTIFLGSRKLPTRRPSNTLLSRHSTLPWRRGNMLRRRRSMLTLLAPLANQRRPGSLLLLSQGQGGNWPPRRYLYRQVWYFWHSMVL